MNRFWYILCGVGLAAGIAVASAGAPAPADELLEPDAAFRISARLIDPGTIAVTYDIADGYYMYRDKFRFRTEPGTATGAQPQFPAGIVKDDPNFGRVETYRQTVSIRIPLSAPIGEGVTLVATSQGCADVGVCYLPITSRVTLKPESGGTSSAEGQPKPLSSILKR